MDNIKRIFTNKRMEQATRWAKIAGRVAALAVHIQGKPKAKDWIVLGAAALDVAMEIRAERESAKAMTAWHYFEGSNNMSASEWDVFPLSLTETAFKHIVEARQMDVPVDDGDPKIFEGRLGGEMIGWSGKGSPTDAPLKIYYKTNRQEATMQALANVIWRDFKTDHLCYTTRGLTEMMQDQHNLLDTEFMETLKIRCSKWLASGKHRGYLIEGPPGTGKSTAVRQVLSRLKMRSLHIELGCLDALAEQSSLSPSINTVIRILQPDAVVIDDVDRVAKEDQAKLLFLLERARSMCKMVFVTVNNRALLLDDNREKDDNRDSALLRPGRLDEHVLSPPLEYSIVRSIVGDGDDSLIERMRTWPIAYVLEYADRKHVLGHAQALSELPELERRASRSVEPDPEVSNNTRQPYQASEF